MKKFTPQIACVLLCSFLLSGCGVIFGGSRFVGHVAVKEHPQADIYVNGNKIGTGAAIGTFKRNRPLVVEVKQEGCEPKTQTFDNTFRGGNFVLSLIMWGFVGVAVDLGTGASYKPDHRHDKAIQQLDTKNFAFTVDYSGCPVTN